jgi:hypothetical protein
MTRIVYPPPVSGCGTGGAAGPRRFVDLLRLTRDRLETLRHVYHRDLPDEELMKVGERAWNLARR